MPDQTLTPGKKTTTAAARRDSSLVIAALLIALLLVVSGIVIFLYVSAASRPAPHLRLNVPHALGGLPRPTPGVPTATR